MSTLAGPTRRFSISRKNRTLLAAALLALGSGKSEVSAQTEIAAERQRQTKAALTNLLQEIEGIPTEEVAAQILALQTRLQASMQTTSMLYQTSLVNYI